MHIRHDDLYQYVSGEEEIRVGLSGAPDAGRLSGVPDIINGGMNGKDNT